MQVSFSLCTDVRLPSENNREERRRRFNVFINARDAKNCVFKHPSSLASTISNFWLTKKCFILVTGSIWRTLRRFRKRLNHWLDCYQEEINYNKPCITCLDGHCDLLCDENILNSESPWVQFAPSSRYWDGRRYKTDRVARWSGTKIETNPHFDGREVREHLTRLWPLNFTKVFVSSFCFQGVFLKSL